MNLGILIFPDVEELDFVGPWEMAGMWNRLSGVPERRLIVAQSNDPMTCANGLSLVPHVSFEQCPQLDVLLVPGGQGTRKEVENSVLISFISEQAKKCEAVLPSAPAHSCSIEPVFCPERRLLLIGAPLIV